MTAAPPRRRSGRSLRRRPPGRRGRWAVAGLLLATVVLVGLPVYVQPPMSPPARADVVVVLGPAEQWRIDWATQLVHDGIADHLTMSVADPSGRPICQERWVTCFRADPFTTRGEARYLAGQMAQRGWTRALVITATPHVERARYILGRCVHDGVQVVGRAPGKPPWWWVYQYSYQTAGWLRAWTQSGC